MTQETIHDMIQRFGRFKRNEDGNILKQGTWYEDGSSGTHYACALGAFFGTIQAAQPRYRMECAGSYAPAWLMNITPTIFDTSYTYDRNFHIHWAAAVYGTDGIIDRAATLTAEARVEAFMAAKDRILACKELNPHASCTLEETLGYTHIDKRMEYAATIITVLDDELVKRGA